MAPRLGKMKRPALSLLLFSLVLICMSDGRSVARPLRVLFIGNSYIYVNDLPWLTAQLASSAKEEGPRVAAGVLSPAEAEVTQQAAWQLAGPASSPQ